MRDRELRRVVHKLKVELFENEAHPTNSREHGGGDPTI
jgi:hypothetical protein